MLVKKLGFVFAPDNHASWMFHYAQVPRPYQLTEQTIRVFFATRNKIDELSTYISRVAYVDINISNFNEVINTSTCPALDVGGKGEFDEFGVMPGCIYNEGNYLKMFYTGWSRPAKYPYRTSIGMATSYDHGVSFQKERVSPQVDLHHHDSILTNGPYRYIHNSKEFLFYSSAIKWLNHNNKLECIYLIKASFRSIKSPFWINLDESIIPTKFSNECQNSPALFYSNNKHYMLFCRRHGLDFRNKKLGYRLACASSDDLLHWEEESLIGIDDSHESWDCEMQCYPGILEINNRYYCFYSGNYFGKSGFGVMELLFE